MNRSAVSDEPAGKVIERWLRLLGRSTVAQTLTFPNNSWTTDLSFAYLTRALYLAQTL
jgi:hypothetical protein